MSELTHMIRSSLVAIALSKKEKLAILERNGQTISGDELYTEEEWGRIMWATHSEINTVLREIMEKKQNEIDDNLRGGTHMVWKKIKPTKVTIKEYQQAAVYGLFFIMGLSVLAWLIRVFS